MSAFHNSENGATWCKSTQHSETLQAHLYLISDFLATITICNTLLEDI